MASGRLYVTSGRRMHQVAATPGHYITTEELGSTACKVACTTKPPNDLSTKARDRSIGRPSNEASNTTTQSSQGMSKAGGDNKAGTDSVR